jgi:hypothetical protein
LSGWSTSSGSGLSHAERLSFGGHDDRVMQEAVEQADGGGVLGQESAPNAVLYNPATRRPKQLLSHVG